MHISIRFTQGDYTRLRQHLFQPCGKEWAAYLFAGPNRTPNALILAVREIWPVPVEAYAHQSAGGLVVKASYIKTVLRHADETGLSLLEVHSHPFSQSGVTFSYVDTSAEAQKFEYVAAKIPQIHHGTLVFGQESMDAHIYEPISRRVVPVDEVRILDTALRTLIPTGIRARPSTNQNGNRVMPEKSDESERYSRQVMAFGTVGQTALSRLVVGIVGLGSVGMLLAQQLAYLGVRHFILVDPDNVELSNLNRLVGATQEDAQKGSWKVDVAARLIQSVACDAQVQALPVSLLDPQAHQVLKGASVLFGATDNHGSRLVLNDRLAVQYLIPYIDVGTGLEADQSGGLEAAGGWVRVVLPGQSCLHCIDAIDREQAAVDLMPSQERERAERAGYVTHADVPAPAVIFLNGTLASLAVAEFMNLVTGFKPPQHLILYDLLKQKTAEVLAQKRADCTSCSPEAFLALGDLEPFPKYTTSFVNAVSVADSFELERGGSVASTTTLSVSRDLEPSLSSEPTASLDVSSEDRACRMRPIRGRVAVAALVGMAISVILLARCSKSIRRF